MAVATSDEDEPRVVLVNSSSKFPERSFTFKKGIITDIDSTLHEWSNYFKCGFKVFLTALSLLDQRVLK
jgi:galactokinase